eukprot:Lithocolla_globosa_v1_NODE_5680_length_1202_cov_8.525719.p2 type:complete len:142 gc:universal NODE_5680_length_1202_cov_8.525719:36-461(+)
MSKSTIFGAVPSRGRLVNSRRRLAIPPSDLAVKRANSGSSILTYFSANLFRLASSSTCLLASVFSINTTSEVVSLISPGPAARSLTGLGCQGKSLPSASARTAAVPSVVMVVLVSLSMMTKEGMPSISNRLDRAASRLRSE